MRKECRSRIRYQMSKRSVSPPAEATFEYAHVIKGLAIWLIGRLVVNAIFNRETSTRR